MNIQNSLEVVEALKVLVIAAKNISKDGISLADLPEALELLKKIDVIVAAVNGIGEIPEELKDIDQAELLELGTKLYSAFKEIKG